MLWRLYAEPWPFSQQRMLGRADDQHLSPSVCSGRASSMLKRVRAPRRRRQTDTIEPAAGHAAGSSPAARPYYKVPRPPDPGSRSRAAPERGPGVRADTKRFSVQDGCNKALRRGVREIFCLNVREGERERGREGESSRAPMCICVAVFRVGGAEWVRLLRRG